MRFVHPTCPNCGGRAVSMLGIVFTSMPLVTDSVNGELGYEYGHSSDIEWNTQMPLASDIDELRLACATGHHWWTLEAAGSSPAATKLELLFPKGDLL